MAPALHSEPFSPDLADDLSDAVTQGTGQRSPPVRAPRVSGGCIHDARRLELEDGRAFFLKIGGTPQVFAREAEGLEALAATNTVRIPAVVAAGAGVRSGTAFLLLELVETGRPGPGFFERFGRRLAEMHRAGTRMAYPEGRDHDEAWGFAHDNFIGATPQENGWHPDWTEFWRQRRLGAMLRRLREAGLSDPQLDRLGDQLMDRLGALLDPVREPPSLLHGDLWGGNYLVDLGGEPVLVDPAAYCGHREADIAMTRLFGGFEDRFHAAYAEAWPLADGADDRLALYELYHLMNHLLLFGPSYRGGCLSRLERLVARAR